MRNRYMPASVQDRRELLASAPFCFVVGRSPGPRRTPPSGYLLGVENCRCCGPLPWVVFYRRRLPHLSEIGQPIFLTWRLYGSLPLHRSFPNQLSSGQQFAALDRLLEETRLGPFYLRQPTLADMVVEAIHHNAHVLSHYVLHAFVVMPNHLHLLLTPAVALPKLTKSLKNITAKRANQMLGLTGHPFWQEEGYDHLVRDDREFERIQLYIETNPVRAGLTTEASEYRWSSAGGQPRFALRTRASALRERTMLSRQYAPNP
jgi:putative transposase